MRTAGPLIILISGILVLVGLFLPWISYDFSAVSDMYGGTSYGGSPSISGWDFIRYHSYLSESSESGSGLSNYSEWLVLIGAILIIGSGMVIFSKCFSEDQMQLSTPFFVMIAFIGVLLAVIGTMTYISDMSKVNAMWAMMGAGSSGFSVNAISTGVILSAVFAFLGIIGVIMTYWKTRLRFALTKPEAPDIGTASMPPSGSVMEYNEKKTGDFGKEPAFMQPTPAPAVPPISTTVPLPSLPPTLDDAGAQKCFLKAGEYETAGDRNKAVEQYTKAIQLNARHTMSYFKRGVLLMEMGFKPAAVADFRRVIDIADNPELTDTAKTHIAKLSA